MNIDRFKAKKKKEHSNDFVVIFRLLYIFAFGKKKHFDDRWVFF